MTPPRFPPAARLRFALWFCGYDLFRWVALPVSGAVAAAVALAAAAATLALAVPSVTAEVRLRRLAESPWARCVWVYNPTELGERFTPARLAKLEAAVRDRAPPGAALSVCGFHDFTLEFIHRDGAELVPRRGRTVGPADELLPAVPRLVRAGPGLAGPDAPGLVLSPTLLGRLGWDPDDPPAEVRVRLPNTLRPRAWPVAGVTRDPLPLGHDFLLTEPEDARLRAADPDRHQTTVWSGPVGPTWPVRWSQFPESVRAAARDGWKIQVKVADRLAGPVLELSSDYARPESDWQVYLGQIERLMKVSHPGDAPGFAVVEADGPPPPPPEPRGAYPKATVYVRELAHLRPAADAARGLDLYANDAARTLVDEIESTAARARAVVLGLVAAFCSAGAVTLVLALYLRGRQKGPQIGMLRAMGATDRVLRALVATEAVVLWAAGTIPGLAAAGAVGWYGCRYYAVTADELRAAAGAGWWVESVVGYLAVSLAGCVAGNLLATRGVRRRPAAESLGLSS